jgi:hypothetical protein
MTKEAAPPRLCRNVRMAWQLPTDSELTPSFSHSAVPSPSHRRPIKWTGHLRGHWHLVGGFLGPGGLPGTVGGASRIDSVIEADCSTRDNGGVLNKLPRKQLGDTSVPGNPKTGPFDASRGGIGADVSKGGRLRRPAGRSREEAAPKAARLLAVASEEQPPEHSQTVLKPSRTS